MAPARGKASLCPEPKTYVENDGLWPAPICSFFFPQVLRALWWLAWHSGQETVRVECTL